MAVAARSAERQRSASLRATVTPDGVRLFLSKGVPVDAPDANGLTPLHLAIIRRPGGSSDWETVRLAEQHEVVALLLAAGANTEVRGRDGKGMSRWLLKIEAAAPSLLVIHEW